MKKSVTWIILGLLLCWPSFKPAAQGYQALTAQAGVTLLAIANQINRFYKTHKKLPSSSLLDTDFPAIGMKAPPSSNWEYFFHCEKDKCNITAEWIHNYYTVETNAGKTLALRLTVRPKTPSRLIYVEARSMLYMYNGTTLFMMEQTGPVSNAVCKQLGGEITRKDKCIIPLPLQEELVSK